MCNPGLACQLNQQNNTYQCLPTAKKGMFCNYTISCEFGTSCWNNTCTRFGSLPVGSPILVTTNQLQDSHWDFLKDGGSFPFSSMLLCESFWAFPLPQELTNANQTHVCAYGLTPYNSTLQRQSPNDNCTYNFTVSGPVYNFTANYTRNPFCGPNQDHSFYCPRYR